ncbi:substrate-binding domain-containing protein [Alphaproteobacteria bacterium GH1-50]|uniref:Substrate-binding domain-containing protein n=1 Tax=Kangsaoukella pontilimi TaxID=2691042 RepID=A0A7C9MJW6_9RHOB|nr:LacI family DNA-binding transcriptional regulator [Kangsaoukella pontilimi]MXQ08095.1 substrate-binding domain-containing protein [Kangsaoukella pontilimi]
MMVEKVTSLDVARLAKVSQSAVSRVFSGASASKATIAKVRAAADQLGYRPNTLARAMITGKSRMIGLVVAYLDNQFYPVALERLSNALQAEGYHVLVFMASNATDNVEPIVQELMDYQVEGIVFASVSISSDLTERCASAGIPVVLFNRGQDGLGLSSVTSANIDGGRQVAEFFVAGGHRRIAHIAGWQGSSTGRDRALGFRQGLKAAGVPLLAEIDGMYSREAAQSAARVLMARSDPPDAIFVGNDHMAFAVMDTLRSELGLSVPNDVSVVGYDDVPLASWDAYSLTSVRQPMNRMVEATVDTLLGQIADRDRPAQKVEIAGPLIVRASARIPEGWKT